MHTSLPLLAAFTPVLTDFVLPIAIMAILFTFIFLIVRTVVHHKHEREKLWHETARLAMEKGQPLPLQQDAPLESRRNKRIRAGLILVAVGSALYLGLPAGSSRMGSYICGFIGLAFLISAVFERGASASGQRPNPPAE